MTPHCIEFEAVVDELAGGGEIAPELVRHADGCARCQAHLALARRIDQALAQWPVPVPPPHFAASLVASTRAAAWRQEVVVDWGFNIALAASLLLIVAGAGAFLWLLGVQAAGSAAWTARPVAEMVGAIRGQALVLTTASVLFVTAVAGWWWAEERQRW